VLAAQHLLRFAFVHLGGEFVQAAGEVFDDGFARSGPLHEHGEIFDAALERVTEIEVVLEPAAALEQLLRRLLVFPEVGFRYALFDRREFL
jgi:hypothetical protein